MDFSNIKMLVMDVDGVLTEGTVVIHEDGSESKFFSLVDGHGIKMWQRAGFRTALISGRASNATTVRAEQLGIEHVQQGCKKKLPAFEKLLDDMDMNADEVVYMGDDLLDLPLVRRAAFGVAVANAVNELKEHADYVTDKPGGRGAVREVIELVLKSTGHWDELMQRYLV
ncbi:3-deoxy-D-manno-octulosonate 8-phosphate phosphatase KdsC [Anaerohalosphaera lusitana]|uniref:3-deoxy-D-manno-octulosonate 8-phosphate phosphatase KdsC n=1 Tax=Anaerohalosphaera lusitana TaxID=1936003 RepID=A0A1U9NLS8_9BACT|nr:HAD hydrolase family protein [Anaerohalosphaera lusitana]AQT68883.1 3-deoxy-D-manno-octulosonate 8-phosphate phosphatase KdsC [Anaerohalosphaera lusitana]